MFDYRAWVERAQKFVIETAPRAPHDECHTHADIAPPLTASQLQLLQDEVERPLPLELQQFWLTASRHCDCQYGLEIIEGEKYYGGATFIDALKLPAELSNCGEWAEIIAEWPDDPTLWLESIPFLSLQNGDYLGLYTPTPQDNPPVAYLSHDDESFILAESFTSFLETWERLCYLGPESWELEEYRDDNGFLTADSPQAQKIRDFFAGKQPIKTALSPSEMIERCQGRLKQLCLIAIMYAQDNDEQLPDAQQWWDAFKPYPMYYDRLLCCPEAKTGGGYAMNANLSRVASHEIQNPEKTVLFFESDLDTSNPHGTNEALPENSHHSNGKVAVGFANGDVRWIGEQDRESLKWTVD